MNFCIFFDGLHPHPLLVWFALSYWGDSITRDDCVHGIYVYNSTSFIGKTSRVIENSQLTSCVIHMSNEHIRSNGLFYNVLLHELGHCHGYKDFDPSPDGVMSYSVIQRNHSFVQSVRFLGLCDRFIPFSPFDYFNDTRDFYEFLQE